MNAATTQTLGLRSLYILPTREGLYYGGVLAVTLLAAINYSNGLAYAFTFLLAAIGTVAILRTHRNLAGLRVGAGPAPPVFAGQPALYTLLLHNDSGTARYAVEVHVDGQIYRVDVPTHASAAVEVSIVTKRRGYFDAPPVSVRTRFPLGLWRAWSRSLPSAGRCLVYPAPGPLRPFAESLVELTGSHRDRLVDGDDFFGLREFRPGDPLQRVAWKKSAGGQAWHTKQFAAPIGESVWLEWDALPGLNEDERLSVLCRWVLQAEQHGMSYGLQLPGQIVRPAAGAEHRQQCLETLALYRAAA